MSALDSVPSLRQSSPELPPSCALWEKAQSQEVEMRSSSVTVSSPTTPTVVDVLFLGMKDSERMKVTNFNVCGVIRSGY